MSNAIVGTHVFETVEEAERYCQDKGIPNRSVRSGKRYGREIFIHALYQINGIREVERQIMCVLEDKSGRVGYDYEQGLRDAYRICKEEENRLERVLDND